MRSWYERNRSLILRLEAFALLVIAVDLIAKTGLKIFVLIVAAQIYAYYYALDQRQAQHPNEG